MAKYRKKPVVVEAVKFNGFDQVCFNDYPNWLREAINNDVIQIPSPSVIGNCLIINTLEGEYCAHPGDYIVKGVKGELYPCKPDIFHETYAEVTINETKAK